MQAASSEGQRKLNTDLSKGFILGGTSAGANFTAGISHLACDEGLSPRITGVVFLAGSFCHPDMRPKKYLDCILSVDEINDAPGLTRKSIDYFAGTIHSGNALHSILIMQQNYMVLPQQTSDCPLFYSIPMLV